MAAFNCANCGKFTDNEGDGFFRHADNGLLCEACAYNDPTLAYEFGYRHGNYGEPPNIRLRQLLSSVAHHYDAGFQAGQRERHHQEAQNAAAEHDSWLADQARYAESERLRRERDRLIRGVRDFSD